MCISLENKFTIIDHRNLYTAAIRCLTLKINTLQSIYFWKGCWSLLIFYRSAKSYFFLCLLCLWWKTSDYFSTLPKKNAILLASVSFSNVNQKSNELMFVVHSHSINCTSLYSLLFFYYRKNIFYDLFLCLRNVNKFIHYVM